MQRFGPTAGGGILFGLAASYGTGRGLGLAVADLDNDGDLDVAAPHSGAGLIHILLNDGDGSFTQAASVVRNDNADLRVPAVAIGDFDEDGNADIVTVDNTNQVALSHRF